MASLPRMNLFAYRDLFYWLYKLFKTPTILPVAHQLFILFVQVRQLIVASRGQSIYRIRKLLQKALYLLGVFGKPCPFRDSSDNNNHILK
jgi:hypothetical protein